MRNPFYIFKLKQEERWPALAALLYVVFWNVLVISKYADKFFALSDNYRKLFLKFQVSGFDPISYIVISQWDTGYNIYRHPLLAFFMFIPNQINQGLMTLTGTNWAVVIMALILTFCAFYSFVLLVRIFHEIVGLRRLDAWLLGWLTFSFGYVIVGISVPDHFCLSMFMLILTLYVAGRKLKAGHPFTKWQTILFFIVTAGISLNNGIKVFLANWFVNGRRFWRPAYLLTAVIIPSAVIWLGARVEWTHFEKPKYVARQEAKAKKNHAQRERILAAFRDTTSLRDSAAIQKAFSNMMKKRMIAKYHSDHQKPWNAHTGKPINKTEFGRWTDISTPRWTSMVENIFGEPIQLHDDHLLGDVLRNRPVIVTYHHAINYIVEAFIVGLFLLGIFCGRRSRFLWLALSFFSFDLVIHFLLGFGLNEVYIMSPHWLFILTIAMAYALKQWEDTRWRMPLRLSVTTLTLWLVLWNGRLYAGYLV